MARSPRDANKSLFSRYALGLSLLQGLSVFIIVMAVYMVSPYRGQGEAKARALSYTTLIVANLGLILANRSWSRTIMETISTPNPALWWVIGGALAILAVALYVPPIRELFSFAYLHFIDLAICFIAGIASILWFEALKIFNRRILCQF